ncbi:MAG: exosortase-associated EpsI family protein, partial [Opitutaceae bacterium]|nr:exosortase-associated EpsI family protein [Opitutaceae bacterium]
MSSPVALTSLPLSAKLNVGLLGVLLTAMGLMLWPHWRHNPDLSHGYFMPVLFLLLLHESRTTGTPRFLPQHWLRAVALVALLIMGLLALSAAGLYATSVGWTHAVVIFSLTCALILFLTAGLVSLAASEVRALPFNWPALVAIGLWILASPIPPGTYSRLTLSLQLSVSENVLHALHFLGIVATRNGNIIELANTSVGVAEACSGVRSLISCIFAGFFFSASMVRSPWARALIILLAAPLALLMNFLRSLILTIAANRGVDISGTWHDITGFAVLGLTALILGALALFLEQPARKNEPAADTDVSRQRTAKLSYSLTAALMLALGLTLFFYANTRSTVSENAPVPDLWAVLPAEADGWSVETSRDLYQFSDTLETKYLAQRTYIKRTDTGPVQFTVYLAYWRAGQTPVSQVASHTPDACWPGAGWVVVPQAQPREQL